MKALSSTLSDVYASGCLTVAHAMRITRTDAEVFGFTSHDVDVEIDGVTYSAAQGFDASQIVTSAGFAVDNLELRTVDDGTLFTRVDVLGGRWRNARFVVFRYNWESPEDGLEYLLAGTFGEVRLLSGQVVVELRGLQQYLQQALGNVTTRTCRARFADYPEPSVGNRCGLAASDYTEAGTVDTVASRAVFVSTDVANSSTADWYGEGVLTWTSGANDGLSQKVRSHAANGTFTLSLPMPADIAEGDAFTVIAGCRKRLAEDCRDKFDNVLNFQGEPHVPGVDVITAPPLPGGG